MDISQIIDSISTKNTVSIKEDDFELHIDHKLPHLIVHIYEEAPNNALLNVIRKQSSYCIAKKSNEIQELLSELGFYLAKKFNSSLIIELFINQQPNALSVFSPLLKDNILLEIFKRKWKDYDNKSLGFQLNQESSSHITLNEEEQKNKSIIWAEFSIPDADIKESTAVSLKAHISQSIKKLCFEFMRLNTSGTFTHSLMYGETIFDQCSKETDEVLAEVSDQLNFIQNITPVNATSAQEAFKENGCSTTPLLTYRLINIDAETIKRKVSDLQFANITAPALSFLFREKRYEIEQKLIMLEHIGTNHFTRISTNLYGEVEESLLKEAKNILISVEKSAETDKEKILDCHEFAELAKTEIEHYKEAFDNPDINCKIHDDGIGLMVDGTTLFIDSSIKISESRAQALIQHEVGTHILTYCNGLRQPIRQLRVGLAQYDQLQEGLAVFSEYLVGGLNNDRLRLIAARVVTVDCMVRGYTFSQAYHLLVDEYALSENHAFDITLRVFRGGGLAKDAVYLRGLINTLKYLQEGGDLKLLFIGKIHLDHIPLIKELLNREVLKEPILPNHYETDEFQERLKKASRKGFQITDMV